MNPDKMNPDKIDLDACPLRLARGHIKYKPNGKFTTTTKVIVNLYQNGCFKQSKAICVE